MRRIANLFTLVALLAIAMPTPSAQTTSAKKHANSEEKPSANLSHAIHHQILVLPFYSVFDFVDFTLDGNKVTLTGYVLRHTLKEHAETAVKNIEGVDTVVNQIEILPTSAADDDLRRAVYRAIYEDSTLAHYAVQNVPPVHIIIKNGAVGLEGSTESLSDKNLAASRANSVANVLNVKNNLVVHAKEGTAQ